MTMRGGSTGHLRTKTACLIVAAGFVTVGVAASSAREGGQAQGQVTFTKDIAPILQRTCQNCHRPNGGLAPMALTTYQEVRPWAKAIKQRTANGEMPPWFIEKNVGIQKFKDDISLSEAEIKTIGAWVDAGAPQGNPADLPPARQFADTNAWSIGEPDLIVNSPLITVKAVGGDYHAPNVGSSPNGLTEDRYIAAWQVKEFRPGETVRTPGRPGQGNNFFVLHHQSISTLPPSERGNGGEGDDESLRVGAFQYTYEVGQNAQFVADGVGMVLKAGAPLYFGSTHQHSIGKEVKLHVQIGFTLHPKGYMPKYSQGTKADINAPPRRVGRRARYSWEYGQHQVRPNSRPAEAGTIGHL